MTTALAYSDTRWNRSGITLTPPSPRQDEAPFGAAAFVNRLPAWYADALDRLRRLTDLSTGWDGHTGKPTTVNAAVYGLEVLGRIMGAGVPLPSIMPLSNGGLQLEWHRKGWDIEIEIVGGPRIVVFTHNLATGEEEEIELDTDLSLLALVTSRIKD
jgi:hypothetical protein